jgi:hypothetical protein
MGRISYSCHVARLLNTTPFDQRCFMGSVNIDSCGGFFHFGALHVEGDMPATSIPVVRFRLPELAPGESGPVALYQRQAREIQAEQDRAEQQHSNLFMMRLFDEKRVDPDRDTYVSLCGWPFALQHAYGSVEALRRDGWNATLIHTTRLIVSEALQNGALLLTPRGTEGFREELQYECQQSNNESPDALEIIFIARWRAPQ